LGFGVWGFGFWVACSHVGGGGLGFEVPGFRSRVLGFGFRVPGSGFSDRELV